MHTGVLRRICEASDIDSLAKIMKQGDRQEKRKMKRKKKKIMNSGRMGSLANNGQQPHVKEFLR